MKKTKKVLLICICVLMLLYFVGGIIYTNIKQKKTIEYKVDNSISIKGYEYVLLDNQTKLYKTEFQTLKENLESDNINYEAYAKSIGKLFIIDLYTLSNKMNMYDVTSQIFVYPEARENYKLNVTNTLYKYLRDKTNDNTKYELPIVSDVEIVSSEEIKFTISEEEYNGYKLIININYEKDLGYDKVAEVIVIKKDKYIYVVEKNNIES